MDPFYKSCRTQRTLGGVERVSSSVCSAGCDRADPTLSSAVNPNCQDQERSCMRKPRTILEIGVQYRQRGVL
ncbi:hypothetical protein chiPu_0002587 [Chiloscyllium punctatum]|uniref:Uncharacterized protein n=1 Tax=Chiloscyllium punctatum TaxID=137246 RepID=A0A401S1C4_CHIPU|nr:hypothetical protein [Chiloscyllium punctatum]